MARKQIYRILVTSALITGFLVGLMAVKTGAVAQAAPSGIASRHTSPQSITLTASDVHSVTGEAFRGGGAIVTNAAVAAVEHVSLATMNRYRVTGYQTSFAHATSSGFVIIADSVGLYKSVAGTKWEYKLFTGQNKPPSGSKPITTSGIGDQSRGYVTGTKSAGSASVYLRRGIYTARLEMSGQSSALSAVAQHLCRILDGRMKAAR
jgi:hypothetical protein